MSDAPIQYKSLPGRGARRLTGRSRLWMGNDHLLLVDTIGYTESYRRFYFRDIQAVIIRKTNIFAVFNAILIIPTVLLAVWALNISNLAGVIALWIFAGVFGFFLFLNLLMGPTCVTQIKTAVQTEPTPAWSRLRAARKGLAKIRPRILEAQGEMSNDELKVRLEDIIRRQIQGSATDAT